MISFETNADHATNRIRQLGAHKRDLKRRLAEAKERVRASTVDPAPFVAAYDRLLADDAAIQAAMPVLEAELTDLASAGRAVAGGKPTQEASRKLAELTALRELARWVGEARRRASLRLGDVNTAADSHQREVEALEAAIAGTEREIDSYGLIAVGREEGLGSISRVVRHALEDARRDDAA